MSTETSDNVQTEYSVSQVATSLNYGKPLSAASRRISYALIALMSVCALVLVVAAIVVICTDQLEQGDEWFYAAFAILLVLFLFIIGVIVWALEQNSKKDKLIEDCFADAVEVEALILLEPYMFNGLNNLSAHVAHFEIDGVEYAVSYSKPPLVSKDRKDLSFYVNKRCRALYSPKHNDVIILNPTQDEEII